MVSSFHPWHNIDPGAHAPRVVNCVIEISKGLRAKYELCKKTGMLKLDRVLHTCFHYPANYGFVPSTLGEDNDPIDLFVLSQENLAPMCLVEARPVGVVHMVDQGERDEKIIAVADRDVSVNFMRDASDLRQSFLDELVHFLEQYKRLESKDVRVEGVGTVQEAERIITGGIDRYTARYGTRTA